jgi:porin
LTPVSETSYVESAEFLDADYGCGCGDLACRKHLFGDWRGSRSCLAQRGIIADLQFTQFYQGVASGGVEQTDAYGGKLDYNLTFLGEPLGLNKGFVAMLHAETRYGEDSNFAAGALAFPNANMLYPLPGETVTSITHLIVMQALNERIALTAGKYNGADPILFGTRFAHRE